MPCSYLASALALALSFLVAEVAGQDPTVALRGKVVDAEGTALSGVTVELLDPEDPWATLRRTRSDERGDYGLEIAADLRPQLAFTAEGFARVQHFHAHASARIDTIALPPGVTLVGRLRAPDGSPVSGAVVETIDMAPAVGVRSRTRSESNGFFKVPGVPPSQVELRVSAEGYVPLRMLEVDRMAPLDLTLESAVEVTGRFVDLEGAPLDGSVYATSEDGQTSSGVCEGGAFQLWVAPGLRYRLRANDARYTQRL